MTIMHGFMFENGNMRIGMFQGPLPEGWYDSPEKAKRAVAPKEEKRPILKLKKKRNG